MTQREEKDRRAEKQQNKTRRLRHHGETAVATSEGGLKSKIGKSDLIEIQAERKVKLDRKSDWEESQTG